MKRLIALAAALGLLSPSLAAAEKKEPIVTGRFIPLAEDYLVSPQIGPEEIAAAKALGVTLIINNRPDGEEIGQPKGAEIEAAAKAAGLSYAAIPVRGMSIGPAEITALAEALSAREGKVLAFCRSGTRSTVLRAYLRARDGASADEIINEAADAGYNIAGQKGALIALGARP